MYVKRLVRFVTPLLLIAFLVGACTQPSLTPEVIEKTVKETVIVAGTPVEKEVVKTVVVEVEVEVTPVPPEKDQARAEQLNIAIGGPIADPTNLNIYAPGVSRSSTGLHQMIYEYFFYNNLQTGEFIPWLATDYTYNDDFTSITSHLADALTSSL